MTPEINQKFEDFMSDMKEEFNKRFNTPTQTAKNLPVTERIKTFEDACRELSISPEEECFIKGSKDTIAYEKLKVIVEALNEGWKPDFEDENEYKYYPYFKVNPFVCCRWGFDGGISGVGARLLFKTQELATYSGTQFLSLYKDYHIGLLQENLEECIDDEDVYPTYYEALNDALEEAFKLI